VPEVLETRTLLSYDLAAILRELSSGQAQVAQLGDGWVADAFGDRVDLPLVEQSADDLFGIGSRLREAFTSVQIAATASLEQARAAFAGMFNAVYLNIEPDGNGDLVRLEWSRSASLGSVRLDVAGRTGFASFDDAVNGSLSGSVQVTATPTVGVTATFGVDVVNGVPRFFVREGAGVRTTGSLRATGALSGTLAIRNLADVAVGATLNAQLGAELVLGDGDATQNEKLRLSDLSASTVQGGLAGSVRLDNAQLTARLPILNDLTWSGSWTATISRPTAGLGTSVTYATPTLNAPDATQLFCGLGSGLFQVTNGVPILGNIGSLLNQPLPVLNVSIAKKLGIEGELGWLLSATSLDTSSLGLDQIANRLRDYGIQVLPAYRTAQNPPTYNWSAAVLDLIEGDRVDLVTFSTRGETKWEGTQTTPPLTAPLPPLPITLEFSATVTASVGWNYYVGLGIETTGFWLDPNTGVSLSGSVQGGVNASASLFGLASLKLSVGAGFGLRAGVALNDPSPGDGRVYLDEIFLDTAGQTEAERVRNSVLGAMRLRPGRRLRLRPWRHQPPHRRRHHHLRRTAPARAGLGHLDQPDHHDHLPRAAADGRQRAPEPGRDAEHRRRPDAD
jgi:hypothetical protein